MVSAIIPRLLYIALLSGCALICGAAAAAYPDRPVHIIVGSATGGTTDLVARVIAQKLSDKWHQSVVVENRVGAGGIIGADVAAHATPDGYTLLMINSMYTITATTHTLNFDPNTAFSPITRVAVTADILLVNPSFISVKSVKELIDLAKSKPGQLNYGSPGGTDSFQHLEMELLMKMSGINMVNIDYAGGGPAVVALLGGEIQSVFGAVSTNMEQVKAGKFKVLAVTTKDRFPLMPDVPTLAEAANLPGLDVPEYFGLMAPAGTPKNIIEQLHDGVLETLDSAEVKKLYVDQGLQAGHDTPAEFLKIIKDDIVRWAALRKTYSIK